MRSARAGRRTLPSIILFGAVALVVLIGAGVAWAAPGSVTGLASSTHPNESTWYSGNDPTFTWHPVIGVVGYAYTIDKSPGTAPPTSQVSLLALDFGARHDLSVGDAANLPNIPYSSPAETAVADLNGDGNLDIVVADKGQSNVSVLLGNGIGGFAPAVNYPTYPSDYPGWDGVSYLTLQPHSVAIGDIGSDGIPDIVVSNSADGTISVLFGTGNGTFSAPDWYAWGGGGAGDMRDIITANLDGDADGIDEIMSAAPLQHAVFVYHAAADGTLIKRDVVTVGGAPEALATGDFNKDGQPDLAVANFGSDSVNILLGNGDGTFAAPVDYAVLNGPHSVVASDFNGDGVLDLAVANWASNRFSVLLGNGNGTFAAAVHSNTTSDLSVPSGLAAADFNGDGVPDLALTDYGLNSVFVFLGMGDGTFSLDPWFSEDTGDEPNSVTAADLDEDGLPDLIVSPNGPASGVVNVFLNQTTAPPSASYTNLTDGVWYFHVRAVDSSSNGGDTATRAVRIDTTPPVTTDDAPTSFTSPSITVDLTPTDASSGMSGGQAGTWYKLDGAASFTAGTSVTVSGVGSHTLQYYSKDAVGNQETTKSVTIVGGTVTQTWTLTASAGAHGSISPSGAKKVNDGTSQTFTITPDTGYHVADVLVDGSSIGAQTSYEFQNVTADHTISASFAVDTFTITVTAGDHGKITPATGTVDYGSDVTYTIKPDAGYTVESLTVDGAAKLPQTSWTFTNVTTAHSIAATFAPKVQPTLGTPKSSKSKVKKNKSFTIRGSVTPGGPDAPQVKITAYRLQGGKWVRYKTFSAKVAVMEYSASVKIGKTGKFRFKASSSADATYLAAKSSMSKTTTVKK